MSIRSDLTTVFNEMNSVGFTRVTDISTTLMQAILMEGYGHQLTLIWENQKIRVALSTNNNHEETRQVFAVVSDNIETLVPAVLGRLQDVGLITSTRTAE